MHVSPNSRSPCGPQPGERHEAPEREQRLVGRHVRRRLLAADVLLARLQGEHEAAVAVEVGRLADDPAGHAADELRPRREEAVVRAAVALRLPMLWPSPIAMSQPYTPGASSTPSEVRSTWATASAPASSRQPRARARPRGSRRSSAAGRSRPRRRLPRQRRRAGSVTPSSWATSTTSSPNPGA